ncbi:tannase/feruloyl esterase family alpha/beta hydrolase [Streptomyces luteogriseus]|uniref:tannase/feruloyl esterase family alpha/beta hydrolase n=1 Tax=Streptomyces luteogriseus TaxID=68233 RepID=UPI0036E590E4
MGRPAEGCDVPADRFANRSPRFQGVGGGGFNGSIPDTESAAKTGYAAAGSDSGHSADSSDASWAWSLTGMNRSLINDFISRALHETTVKGKVVTQAFYGTSPNYAYWNGCSNGGREGLQKRRSSPATTTASWPARRRSRRTGSSLRRCGPRS